MAKSIAIVLLFGFLFGEVFKKLKLPTLLGIIISGVIIGPFGFNLLSKSMISISADIRMMALIIILLRAGFGINKRALQSVGMSAFKMSWIPGVFEGIAVMFISHYLFNFSFSEGGMLGFIMAAVSPAVVVPAMLKLEKLNLGIKKAIPTIIVTSASIDDIFAITIFNIFVGLYFGKNFNIFKSALNIPISIGLGLLLGFIFAKIFIFAFKQFEISNINKLILVLSVSILFVQLEEFLKPTINIASLLAVMAMGYFITDKMEDVGIELSVFLGKIWTVAQIFLFSLIGSEVNIPIAVNAGLKGIIVISFGLIFRSIGVFISLRKSNLNFKEKMFSSIAFTPKATVQAAIGGLPLALGVKGGEIILAISVLSIIFTAPLGTIAIDKTSEILLKE